MPEPEKLYNYNINKSRMVLLGLMSLGIATYILCQILTHDWHFKPCRWCDALSPGMSILLMPICVLLMAFFGNVALQMAYRNRRSDCQLLLDSDGISIINAGDRESPEDFISYSAITRIASTHTPQFRSNAIIGVTLECYPHSKLFIKSYFDSAELFDDFIRALTEATGYELQDIPNWQRKQVKAKG